MVSGVLHQCLRYSALSVEVGKLLDVYLPKPLKHWALDLERMVTAPDGQKISLHISLLSANIYIHGRTSRKSWLLYCGIADRTSYYPNKAIPAICDVNVTKCVALELIKLINTQCGTMLNGGVSNPICRSRNPNWPNGALSKKVINIKNVVEIFSRNIRNNRNLAEKLTNRNNWRFEFMCEHQ